MDPFTMMAVGQAGLGLAKGIGGAIAAKRSFSDDEKERLEELRRLRESGQMGLSEADRQSLEASLANQRGAALRQAETLSTQRAQAAGGSGRELFLAEMAGQSAEQQARLAGAEIIAQQEQAARQAQQAEMMNLAQQEAAAKAGVISALTGGITEGGQAALGAGMQYRMQQQQFEQEAEMERQRIIREATASGMMTQAQLDAFLNESGGGAAAPEKPPLDIPSLEELQMEEMLRRTSPTTLPATGGPLAYPYTRTV